ncbi:hypothetical protein ACFL3H_10215 [Gemmatimonadota bacterium]
MTGRTRPAWLIPTLMLILITTTVTLISLRIFYRSAFDQQYNRLTQLTLIQAQWLEAIARLDEQESTGVLPETLSERALATMIEVRRDFEGFGKTGTFMLARQDDNQITFFPIHRGSGTDNVESVPADADLAEPMRLALLGQSGTIMGLDYRGVRVLAAYRPVAHLDLGIVAKIDLSEVRAPLIRASLTASTIAVLVIVLGVVATGPSN